MPAMSHALLHNATSLKRLDQFSYHHTLAETEGRALVIFTGPACGACRRLKSVLSVHAAEFADLQLFEVDAGEDMALTREFNVFHLPAMFLYRNGHFHCELQSEATPLRLRQAIDAAFAAPPQEQP